MFYFVVYFIFDQCLKLFKYFQLGRLVGETWVLVMLVSVEDAAVGNVEFELDFNETRIDDELLDVICDFTIFHFKYYIVIFYII